VSLTRELEALLFAAATPLTLAELARYLPDGTDIPARLADLANTYATRGIQLVERGGGWLFQTAPDLAHVVQPARDRPAKLSKAAVETLAIIAYHEPVTRPEIEGVRGVAVSAGYSTAATCPASPTSRQRGCSTPRSAPTALGMTARRETARSARHFRARPDP